MSITDTASGAKRVPALRFPEFEGEWGKYTVDDVLRREGDPVEVNPDELYRQIGVRSHGRGLFHKDAVTGADLGGKRVFHVVPNSLVVNIVFAWEQAVALTTDAEKGFIASHRFPMYLEKDELSFLPFIREMFLRKRGKQLLELASPGGAGRNKTLGQQEFLKLKVTLPKREEQKKIAEFLGVVDSKIAGLKARQEGLERYKRGLMQALFSQRLRFTRPDGTAFPDWEEKLVGDILSPSSVKGSRGDKARKISVQLWARGVRESGRAGSISTQYYVRKSGQFIYSKLDFLNCAFAIIPDEFDGLESTVDLPAFDISPKANPYFLLNYIIRRSFYEKYGSTADGSRKARRIQENVFMGFPIFLPHPDEQQKIAGALQAMDAKIAALARQVAKMEDFKKGLLQQMFV
ncbi:restriction endonuclease subunit S [Halocynthiibacter sp. C4]|uniref:restriction endonuclease subunit S n=1 Tax=Halocynthiibacter sp. C4 TaxID=2992758 RepID=UPI00237C3984|nr:restriction endonuclease subunit S [Halocynthiibacter sp. C4]MDE0588582.1 restriction endonuclease subunit S [Halocynthiibacter sp. C4]